MTTREHFSTPYEAYQESFTDQAPTASELMRLIADSRPILKRAVQPQGLVHASMCLDMLPHVPHAEAANAMLAEAEESLDREIEVGHHERAFLAGVTRIFMPKYRARFLERRQATMDEELELWEDLLNPDILVIDGTMRDRSYYEKFVALYALTARTNIVHERIEYQTWPTLARQSADAVCSSKGFAQPDAATFQVFSRSVDSVIPRNKQLLVQPLGQPRSTQEFAAALRREAQLYRYEDSGHLNGNQTRELYILRERNGNAGEQLFDRLYEIEGALKN